MALFRFLTLNVKNGYFWPKMGYSWPQNEIGDFQNYFHLNGNKKLCQYLQYLPSLNTESNLKTLIPLFVEAPCIKFTKSKVNYEKINFIKCILFKCLLKFVRYPSYLWDVTWFGHTLVWWCLTSPGRYYSGQNI